MPEQWTGTIAVDDAGDLHPLYDLSGVDVEEWRICGIDIRLHKGRAVHAGVFAIERSRLNAVEGDWRRLAEHHDATIPVSEFRLDPALAFEVLAILDDVSIVAVRDGIVVEDGVSMQVTESVIPLAPQPVS